MFTGFVLLGNVGLGGFESFRVVLGILLGGGREGVLVLDSEAGMGCGAGRSFYFVGVFLLVDDS